jgi:pimeloyl-ACP methyl ester carboxylesterase
MIALWRNWIRSLGAPSYVRRQPLVLVNGLAEQAESWFANVKAWRRHFEVYTPTLVAYDRESLHERIEEGHPIDVEYLVERLRIYLRSFVQTPPYNLLANSMGGKIAVEYAVRYPEDVRRLVLLCPSGLAVEERLPIVEGVRGRDMQAVIDSVFSDRRFSHPRLADYYQARLKDKRWRTGLLRTIRGTTSHSVRNRLAEVTQPTLLVVGSEDRIVDPVQSIAAGRQLPRGQIVVLPKCGHAPQIERARKVNRLVIDFLNERDKPID